MFIKNFYMVASIDTVVTIMPSFQFRVITMKKGFWTRKTHLFRRDEYICSVCGRIADKPYRACPVCKAVMVKARYDPHWVDEAEGLSAMVDDDW